MTTKHLFPPGKPSLDLNFAGERELDPRITFTRSSIGTFINSKGQVETAQVNEPRFEYDGGTGDSLGLLIEQASTNHQTGSQNFGSNSYWREFAGTRGSTTELAPDGTNTACQFFETTATNANRGCRGTPVVQIQSTDIAFTWSVFVRPIGGLDTFKIATYGSGGPEANFTFSTLSWQWNNLSFVGLDASIKKLANGWYRCSMTLDNSTTRYIAPSFTTNTGNAAGSPTVGFVLWGAQTEFLSFPTAYIATTTVADDRDADLATASVSLSATKFSHLVNWDGPNPTANKSIVYLDVGGAQTKAAIKVSKSTAMPTRKVQAWMDTRFNPGSGGQGGFPSVIMYNTDPPYAYSLASSWDSTAGLIQFTDGAQVLTNAAPIPGSNGNPFTRVVFGFDGFTGHVARYAYWSHVLLIDQLEALTS